MKENQVKVKEVIRFLVSGISAVATDLTSYYFLLRFLDSFYAKALSFILGTLVAYILNKYWTFECNKFCKRELIRFIILYISTLIANISVNKACLELLFTSYFIGFLCATGTSTILNFIGQKWWVFYNANQTANNSQNKAL